MKQKLFFSIALLILISCSKDNNIVDPIVGKYKDLKVIDVHNHDASGCKYKSSIDIWDTYSIEQIVLFGDISEPSAVTTDNIAWNAYKENPSRFIPFFAGFNIKDSSCLKIVAENFEKGFFGIGEFVAASSNSPITSNLPWKGDHPMDGYFPQVYELCAKYKAPILLHIDPPFGYPIDKLKEALIKFPNTNFIFGHANAYNSPANIETLLKNYDNIYIDFFAGFTKYNPGSSNSLEDYVPLINKYPDKFMVSTDSGYDVGYDNAYKAIYELFDLLGDDVVEKIAHKNFEALIRNK